MWNFNGEKFEFSSHVKREKKKPSSVKEAPRQICWKECLNNATFLRVVNERNNHKFNWARIYENIFRCEANCEKFQTIEEDFRDALEQI